MVPLLHANPALRAAKADEQRYRGGYDRAPRRSSLWMLDIRLPKEWVACPFGSFPPKRSASVAEADPQINEYLDTGHIAEADTVLASERYQALRSFAEIYTVGTSTAAQLWKAGCRTLEDVRSHLGADALPPPPESQEARARAKRRLEGNMTRSEIVSDWLDILDDLTTT